MCVCVFCSDVCVLFVQMCVCMLFVQMCVCSGHIMPPPSLWRVCFPKTALEKSAAFYRSLNSVLAVNTWGSRLTELINALQVSVVLENLTKIYVFFQRMRATKTKFIILIFRCKISYAWSASSPRVAQTNIPVSFQLWCFSKSCNITDVLWSCCTAGLSFHETYVARGQSQ